MMQIGGIRWNWLDAGRRNSKRSLMGWKKSNWSITRRNFKVWNETFSPTRKPYHPPVYGPLDGPEHQRPIDHWSVQRAVKSSRNILPLFRAPSWRIYLFSLCGPAYFRVFHRQGAAYSLARLGKLSRSINGIQAFSPEPDRGFPEMSDM